MFEIKSDRVILTEDSQYGRAGEDVGHVADVLVNHLAAIDPANPTESLPYKVARACCDAHKAEVAALERQHEAEIKRLTEPAPEDADAIEAAAKRKAADMRRELAIDQRARELVAEG